MQQQRITALCNSVATWLSTWVDSLHLVARIAAVITHALQKEVLELCMSCRAASASYIDRCRGLIKPAHSMPATLSNSDEADLATKAHGLDSPRRLRIPLASGKGSINLRSMSQMAIISCADSTVKLITGRRRRKPQAGGRAQSVQSLLAAAWGRATGTNGPGT